MFEFCETLEEQLESISCLLDKYWMVPDVPGRSCV